MKSLAKLGFGWVSIDSVRNAGDFFTAKIGNDPIVIVRANDRELHGLINVCRHRGARVVSGEGNMKSFVCPYHNWTYGLDGGLRGTPGLDWSDMQGIEGFDSQKFGLHPLRVASWKGMVFVNFDMDAEPLEAFLGEFGSVLDRFDLAKLSLAKSQQVDLKVNWKIFGDNMCEEYHIPYLHRDTLYKGVEERVVKPHGNSVGFYDKLETPKAESAVSSLAGPTGGRDDRGRSHAPLVLLPVSRIAIVSDALHACGVQPCTDGTVVLLGPPRLLFPGPSEGV